MSQMVRVKELSKMLSMGKSTIWLKVAKGEFPKPIKLSERTTAWRIDDVNKWIEQRAAEA